MLIKSALASLPRAPETSTTRLLDIPAITDDVGACLENSQVYFLVVAVDFVVNEASYSSKTI